MKECVTHHHACDCREAQAEKDSKNSDRYEFVRTLSPRQFNDLWMLALSGRSFDDLVDEGVNARELDRAIADRIDRLTAARTLTASPTGQINPDVINPSPVAAVGDS